MTIRPPTKDELSGLSDLCFRSKGVWDYDDEFMEAIAACCHSNQAHRGRRMGRQANRS